MPGWGSQVRWLEARWFPQVFVSPPPLSLSALIFFLCAWPLQWLFACLVICRHMAYDLGWYAATRLPVPVIVVGNITVGGSGKTPLTLWLTQQLRLRGWSPGIISRGYGGASEEAVHPVFSDSDPAIVGDEPVLLAQRAQCPVWVGRRRVLAGQALLAAHRETNIIICDDGLQHLALHRDAEVAVFDTRGIGNGYLLPLGPLREGLHRLKNVQAVVCHGEPDSRLQEAAGALPLFSMRLEPGDFYALNAPEKRATAMDLVRSGALIHAVAGIGYPERFFQTLQTLGLSVVRHPFPDHHPFVPGDLDFVGENLLVMTEKDAVKCRSFAPERTWVLPVTASLPPSFVDTLLENING